MIKYIKQFFKQFSEIPGLENKSDKADSAVQTAVEEIERLFIVLKQFDNANKPPGPLN